MMEMESGQGNVVRNGSSLDAGALISVYLLNHFGPSSLLNPRNFPVLPPWTGTPAECGG
jgi:hypothetical protein